MAIQFGVVTAPGSYGYIQSFASTQTEEIGEARDANGDVAAYNQYNEQEEISFEYVYSGTAPAIGATLTITVEGASRKYIVTQRGLTESNTDYQRMSITAKRYIANTLPA
jgi:hypothetical protein